jgi:hypothetical protein
MSDTGFTVPGMTEPPRRYDITITVDRDGGYLPNPAEFTVTALQAAAARDAAIVSAHTAGQIISVVSPSRPWTGPPPSPPPWPWSPKRSGAQSRLPPADTTADRPARRLPNRCPGIPDVSRAPREPPRGNQDLGLGQDAHHDSMGTCGAP